MAVELLKLLKPALRAAAAFIGSLIENVFGELAGDNVESLIDSYKDKKMKNELQSKILSEIEDFNKHHKKTAERFFGIICDEIQWDNQVLGVNSSEDLVSLTFDEFAERVAHELIPIPAESLHYQFQRNIYHFKGLTNHDKLIRDFITTLLRIQDARAQYWMKHLSVKDKAEVELTVQMIANLVAPLHVVNCQFSDAVNDAQDFFENMICSSANMSSQTVKYWESKINPKVKREAINYFTWIHTGYESRVNSLNDPTRPEYEINEIKKELIYWRQLQDNVCRWEAVYFIPDGGKFNKGFKTDFIGAEKKEAVQKSPSEMPVSSMPPVLPSSTPLNPSVVSESKRVTPHSTPITPLNLSAKPLPKPQPEKPMVGDTISVTIFARHESGLIANWGNCLVYIPCGELEDVFSQSPDQMRTLINKKRKVQVTGFQSSPTGEDIIIASRKALLPNKVQVTGFQSSPTGEDIIIASRKALLPNTEIESSETKSVDSKKRVEIFSGICFIKGASQIAFGDIDNKNFDRIVWDDNNLKRIGDATFKNCVELTHSRNFSIQPGNEALCIPNSVNYIGKQAFAGCEKLSRVIIPSSVTFMDENVFMNCSANLSIYCLANVEKSKGWNRYWAPPNVKVYWGTKIGKDYSIIIPKR